MRYFHPQMHVTPGGLVYKDISMLKSILVNKYVQNLASDFLSAQPLHQSYAIL